MSTTLSSDMLILAALKDKARYGSLIRSVPMDTLSSDAAWLLRWFAVYWKSYPEHTVLDPDALFTLLRMRGKLDADQIAVAERLCKLLAVELGKDTVNAVVLQLVERGFAGEAARLIMDYQAGAEIDLAHQLHALARETTDSMSASSALSYIGGAEIHSVLEEEDGQHGIRLDFLQGFKDGLSPLLPGDNIMFAAGVDSGKTSLLAAMNAHIAPQLQELYGDRCILWLNNEGNTRRMLRRQYNAALRATKDELDVMGADGTLLDKYSKAMHGQDRVRFVQAHGWSVGQIERCIQTFRPAVVIYDMMANFHTGARGEQKNHDKVEALWQESREAAVRHDFVAIGTAQLSVDGYDTPYPALTNIKDTKVGAQGALDVALMMGDRRGTPGFENVRWFSTPKNKRRPVGAQTMRFQAAFDLDRSVFSDGAVE